MAMRNRNRYEIARDALEAILEEPSTTVSWLMRRTETSYTLLKHVLNFMEKKEYILKDEKGRYRITPLGISHLQALKKLSDDYSGLF